MYYDYDIKSYQESLQARLIVAAVLNESRVCVQNCAGPTLSGRDGEALAASAGLDGQPDGDGLRLRGCLPAFADQNGCGSGCQESLKQNKYDFLN